MPVHPAEDAEMSHHWDYIYEPEAKEVLDMVLERYIESLVYQAVVENVACEMASRMIAMKNATENAGTMIDELQPDLQPRTPGGDYPGNLRNRRRRGSGLKAPI